MLTNPMDVLTAFPVRKTKGQKQAFREAVGDYVSGLGYESQVENGSFGSRNLVIGDPETAKYLITAHYDTCAALPVPNFITPCNLPLYLLYQIALVVLIFGVCAIGGIGFGFLSGSADVGMAVWYLLIWVCVVLMLVGPANRSNANDNTSGVVTVLEIARTLPENLRGRVCFVLFDLEEAGLIGSASYRKAHKKATDGQIVLNLDCVGDGDELRMFPTKKLRKDKRKLASLYCACGYFGKKNLLVEEKGIYPSDQANFPLGVGICALRRGKIGLYLARIHTKKDTILEQTNVNILRAALTTYLSRDAAQ